MLNVISVSGGMATAEMRQACKMIYFCPKGKKKIGVTDFVLERTCPEKYPKSEKWGYVS